MYLTSPIVFTDKFKGYVPREGVIINHDVIVIFPLGRFYYILINGHRYKIIANGHS